MAVHQFLHTISNFQPKRTTKFKPLAIVQRAGKMRVPYKLKEGQISVFHELPSGLRMEVIVQKGKRSGKNPLVFVHGSYHAAWCWAEYWLPFLAGFGFDCYAVSLLGQGESDAPADSVAGTLQTHASDVADFIKNNLSLPPVLLGHSFGGLIDAAELMKESSRMPLFDLRKLNASLPVVTSTPTSSIDVLVMGANDDFIVDAKGICVEGVAHDIMLDCSWKKGAEPILSWLNGLN